MFKALRIFILLFILAAVATSAWRAKTDSVSWKYTLMVNVYPINGDGSIASENYIRGLTVEEYKPIEDFMRKAADQYGRAANATIEMRLQPQLYQHPPAPPSSGRKLDVIWWSLQFRWWAYRHTETRGPGPQVKLFVQYFDPNNKQVHHSTALEKGLIGRVNVFASAEMRQKNNVIIAHEFLHTLGATDKYNLSDDQPIFPDGYAEPDRTPVLPQRLAEIMGGRVPITQTDAAIPIDLLHTVVGVKTAREINLLVESRP